MSPGEQLRRTLEDAFSGARVVLLDSTPWVSATFTGARHRLTLTADSLPGEAALADMEFALASQVVADLAVVARTADALELEALILEE